MSSDRVGDPLDDTTRTSHQPAGGADLGQNVAYPVVMAGSNVGEMYKLDKAQLVIGRGDKAGLRLTDDGISRDHARIVREAGQLILEDMGSGISCPASRTIRA